MMLITGVLDIADTSVRAFATIGDQHALFLDDANRATPSLLVELMAQTVGCFSGYKSRCQGKPPAVGFLLGSRNIAFYVPAVKKGDVVVIEAQCTFLGEEELPSQFDCRASVVSPEKKKEAARATLTVYQPNDLSPFE